MAKRELHHDYGRRGADADKTGRKPRRAWCVRPGGEAEPCERRHDFGGRGPVKERRHGPPRE
jgi:hypothetical protein